MTLDLNDSHVALLDLRHAFAGWTGDSDVVWVTIPWDRLRPFSWPRNVAVVNLHRRSPRGRVLTAAVEHLWAEVVAAPASRAHELATGIIDTVRAVLRPGDFAPDDRGLTLAMKDHIAANLPDLALGPDSLRATFFCSRSALYRLFRADGGVAAYIRNQRLLRCFDELTQPAAANTSITTIATRWGFENPSHFNRLFKATFGLSPSLVVPEAHDDASRRVSTTGASDQIAQFHRWAAAL
jgi:AraC-like DNA-binding protein